MKKNELLLGISGISSVLNLFVGLILLNKDESIKILILLLIQELLILFNFINFVKILYKYNER